MARSYDGDLFVTIGANTEPAEKKIDALFNKIDTLQHVNIDANINTLQRKLETLAKRTNDQLSSGLVKGMLKDFKTVLGAMKTEFENNGPDTAIYKRLEKTANIIESRFENLNVSVGKKQLAGLEQILNNVAELESISNVKFETIVSTQDVKNSDNIVKNVKQTKKELDSIVSKIDYIDKTLKKNVDSALSEQKLKGYEQKVLGLQEALKSFSEIDSPLIKSSLLNATVKAAEVLGQISDKQAVVAQKQADAQQVVAKSQDVIVAGKKEEVSATKQAEQAQKKLNKSRSKFDINKATQKYNEIMEKLGYAEKTIGTSLSQGRDGWGLKEMLDEAKTVLDTFYEIGHANNDLKNESLNTWKSYTASLRGFISGYAKHYEGSAEAIYDKVQAKKKEWAKYESPKWDNSVTQDDDKYLAFKQKELEYEEKRLQVAKELVQLTNKYRNAPLYTLKEKRNLDEEDSPIDVNGLSEMIKGLEDAVAYSKRAVERIAQDIETKRRIASPQYTPVLSDGKKTAWGSTDDPKKAYKYIRDQHWSMVPGVRLDLNSMAKESPDEASKKYLETRREINDILKKEKLGYQDIIKLLEVYNQKSYQTLTQSRYIADAINMAADIEQKLGRGSDFAYDNYLTGVLSSLNEPGKMMSSYFDAFAGMIAKQLGVGNDPVEEASGALKDFSKTLGNSAQNEFSISSYQDLYKALEKIVDLSKQLKPGFTAEYSKLQDIMNAAEYPESRDDLIANIGAQIDNVKRIKSSVKNGLSVYQYRDRSGYEAQYGIDQNTLKDAERMLNAYIYQAVEYFGYAVSDVMNDFSQKRARTLIENAINQYLGAASQNETYQVEAEAFNEPIQAVIESITSAIYGMTVDPGSLDKVSDYVSELKNRPEDVTRYTLSAYSNHVGSLLGINTPYAEIEANAKKIASYEELCEVISRYNELQDKAVVFGGHTDPGLGEAEEMERQLLRARLTATGGKDIFKLAGFSGFRDVDQVAKALGIEQKPIGVPVTPTVAPGTVQAEIIESASAPVEVPVTPTSDITAIKDLEKFDADKESVLASIESESDFNIDGAFSRLEQIWNGVREQVANGTLSYENAYNTLMMETSNLWTEMTKDVEDTTKTVRKLSPKEYGKIYDGTDVQKMLDDWRVAKNDQKDIYEEFKNLGNMVVGKEDIAEIQGQKDYIVSLVLKSARKDIDSGLDWFLDEIGKIYYDNDEIKEIGKPIFEDIRRELSQYKILTNKNKNGLRADEFFTGLSDGAQGVIQGAFERTHGVGFNGSKSNILQGLAAALDKANDKFTGLSDDEQDALRQEAIEVVDKVVDNVENLRKVESGVTDEIVKQNKAREAGAKQTKKDKGPVDVDILEKTVDDALAQLRNASDNKTAFIDLTDVHSAEDLENEIRNMAQLIAGSDLKVDSVIEQDGIARVTLYNEQLGITASQMWRLQKATEDASEAQLELISETRKHSPRAAQKFSDAQQKKIDSDNRWLISQMAALDKKELSYKYSNKKISGATKILNTDDRYFGKTIDQLTNSIRDRITGAMDGALTEPIENEILDALRVLDMEIKKEQSGKYVKGKLSAQEVKEAKATREYELNTFEQDAKNKNVFVQLKDDIKAMHDELDSVTEQDSSGLDRFVDKMRTAKAHLALETTKETENKNALSNYEKAIQAQDRLYESRKKLVKLQLDESTSDSSLQVADRQTKENEQQYEASLQLLKTAEDYNAVKQRELQLEEELKSVMFEQRAAQLQRLEDAENKNIAADTQQDITRYEQEQNALQKARLEIQKEQTEEHKKQKANQEEIIRLQNRYNKADYNWHLADIDGRDKSPYNEEMESYVAQMEELRKTTKLTAEQEIELNRINNEHLLKKQKLLNAASAADSASLAELQTFSRWKSDIKNVGMLSDEAVQRIENMGNAIADISSSTDIKKLAEDFKTLQSDVKYETTQSKATKTRMSEIKASLNAQKQELKALYGELDLDLPLGDKAPSAHDIQDNYLNAISAIERCTSAIGEQTQEEIANATASANAAKIKMDAYKEMQDQFEAARLVEEQKTGDGAIKQYYQTLNSTIQQIANLDSKINNLKLKDDGSGTWATIIDSLDMQREQLLQKVHDTVYKINDAFSDGFVQGENKIELPFSSILQNLKDEDASQVIQDFFNDFRVQETLTEQSIVSFVSNLQNAQNKAEEFATVLAERLSVVSKSAKTLSDLGRSGAISTDHELYKGGLDRLAIVDRYKSTLPSDPTTWSAEQTVTIQKLANDLNEYVSALDKATSKEKEYFASKKQYANIANVQDYDEMSSSLDKISNSTNRAKEDLEKFVSGFTDGRGIITGFTTSADGISRIDFSVLEEGTGYLRNFSAEMGQFTSNVYTFETSMNNMTAGTKAAQNALAAMSQVMSRLNSRGFTTDNNEYVTNLYDQMQSLSKALASIGTSKDVGDQNVLQNMANDANRLIKTLGQLENAHLKVKDAIADGDMIQVGKLEENENAYEKMAQCAKELAATMPDSTLAIGQFNEKTKELPVSIETADGEIKSFILNVEKLGKTVTATLKSTDKAKSGISELFDGVFGEKGKGVAQLAAMYLSTYDIIRYLRQGFNEVLEIDTAMTELKKVTNETDVAYSNFLKNAYTSSKKIGTTMKDFTQATSDFARLGYSMDEASKLAEAANVYMNVGDGIDNVEDASKSIISTMKAFGVEAEDAMGIVNKFNEVGNNFAIDSVGIGEAFQRSASALSEAGNTIDESIALVTGANTVVQNPEQVGTALKTLALRLRGAKVELEEAGLETDNMAESTSTLQAKLQALTHGKVDIMEDAETFKSTTQILREMADAWEYMTDIERASALELMGGKRQANILSSLITNFDIVEDVIESSLNSENSAIEENAKYMDSMQGRIDQLSNSMQSMWVNAMDSDMMKFLISLVDGFVQLTDKAGLLNVALGALFGKTAFSGKKFGIANLFTGIVSGAEGATKGITLFGKALTVGSTAFKIFNGIATAGVALLAGAAISGLIKFADELIVTTEEIKEAANQARETIKSLSSDFKSNEKFVSGNTKRFAELAQGVDMLTGKNLSLSTDDYEEFLDLSNQLADVFPTLSRNYDENGNAIVQLSGSTNTMVSSLENLLEAQRQITNQKIADNLPDLYAGVKLKSDDFNKEIDALESKSKAYQDSLNVLQSDVANTINELFNTGKFEISNDEQGIILAENVRKILREAGMNLHSFTNEDWFGNITGYTYRLPLEYSDEEIKEARNKISSGIDTIGNEYITKINELNSDITKNTNANKANWSSLSSAISSWLSTDSTYQILDDKTQSMVQSVINNLDYSSLDFKTWEDAQDWISTNLLDIFSDTSVRDSINKQLSDMFDFQYKLQNGDISLNDYKTQISSFVDFVKNSGFGQEVQEQLMQMFDIDPKQFDKNANHLGKSIDTMVEHAKKLVSKNLHDKLYDLDYQDLQLLYQVDANTTPFMKSMDAVQNKIKEVKIASTKNFTTDGFANYAESVDTISSSISTYKESLEKLESGSFTFTDFMSLIAQYPELAKGVDVASKSFDGLEGNLRSAIKASPKNLIKDLQELKYQLQEAGKSTEYIDQLIEAVENMPEDAVKGLSDEYITLADKINAAKVAQNELNAAMQANPNEGFETRGSAIKQMQDLMSKGLIGSESELWGIAEAFGFTYNSADTINENTDALYEFIKARQKWYATDKDGNYTFNGTESFLNDVEKVVANNEKLQKMGIKWSYEDGALDFDFNNADWDEIVSILGETKELAGLTSEEFYDLIVQAGQFFEINWENSSDILSYLDSIAEGTDEATEKLKKFAAAMEQAFGKYGKDPDIDLADRPIVNQKTMQDKGWGDFEDDYATVYSSSYSTEDGSKTVVLTPILPNGEVLSPKQLQTYADKLLAGEELEPGVDIKLAEFEGEDSIEKANEYAEALHEAQEQYQELQDPLGLEVSLAKDGIEGLNKIADLQGSIKADSDGVTVVDVDAFESALDAAGYTKQQIDNLIAKVKEYENVCEITTNDPLGLNNTNKSIDTVAASLNYLGIEWEATKGTLEDPAEININANDLITTLQSKGWSREQIVSYIQTLTSTTSGLNIQVDGQVDMSTEQIDAAIESANADAKVTLTLDTTAVDGYSPEDKYADVVYSVDAKKINSYKPPTKYGTVVYKGTTGDGEANGTAHISGTAHAQGTAYKSGSWGAQETETALTGELGPELLVRGNKWTVIGQDGAEFTQIKKGDIIFNHKQTEDLLSKGYVTGRGRAYASGTAYASGSGSYKKYDFGSTSGSGASALSKAADKISDAGDKFKDIFDWIEVRLEEITEVLDLKSAKLENKIGYYNKNDIIDDMIEVNEQLYDNLIAGAKEYNDFAEELLQNIPEQYREAAKDGKIAIESFVGEKDEKTFEAIEEYREWVQKGADATQRAEETLTEISNLAKEAFDNIVSYYENEISLGDSKIDQLNAYNALSETDLGAESANIYQAMIKETNKNIDILDAQRNAMQAELNKRVGTGEIKKYSDAWYEAVNEISAVDTEIIKLTTDVENYQDAINELYWDNFDNLIERFESISDEAEDLIDILRTKDVVDDEGNWTDEGITSLGLYAQQMENAKIQAQKYKEEIDHLNNNWKNLGYTEQEYIDKLDELKDGQYDAIKAYNDTKDAIVDLNKERVDAIKEGIQKEIEAYEELINKKKEELDAEKDLYDFQKGVANQQKDIADIERKLAALSADNSASARAQRAKLQAELLEAQAKLEETYYKRSISDQQEALDKELENFQDEKNKEIESWNTYLENAEQVVADSLDTVLSNTKIVYKTLQDIGKEYSLEISETLTSPWEYGKYAIQDYYEKFCSSMSITAFELREVAREYKKIMEEIEGYGDKVVNQANDNAAKYQNKKTSSENSNVSNQRDNEIKVGDKINAGNSKIYDHKGDTSGQKQYYYDDPVYRVINVNGNWIQVRHHSLSGGVTGWFKKSGISQYAKGTNGVDKDQLALIDELGEELVMHAGANGKLAFLSKGSAVVPHDISENLMQLGRLNPQEVLDRARPVINAPNIVNNNIEVNMDIAEVVHIDTVTNETIPNLTKAIEKQMDKYMKNINSNIRKYAR